MADDLEAFLRQAAQRRVQRQKQPQQRQPQRLVPQKPRTPPVIEATALEGEPVEPTRRLSTVDIQDHADHLGSEHLGEDVGFADEKMEAHLHREFDHAVGSLKESDRMEPAEPATIETFSLNVADLAILLQNPRSIRQAILLSEIFAPPAQRW